MAGRADDRLMDDSESAFRESRIIDPAHPFLPPTQPIDITALLKRQQEDADEPATE
jgi:hypothetical protein